LKNKPKKGDFFPQHNQNSVILRKNKIQINLDIQNKEIGISFTKYSKLSNITYFVKGQSPCLNLIDIYIIWRSNVALSQKYKNNSTVAVQIT
jgi:hypothetical protein